MKISTDISAGEIGRAIARLREHLRMTQKAFARMIEDELEGRGVQRWEACESIPSGDRMLRMLRECKDKESLGYFGIDISEGASIIPSACKEELPKEEEEARPGATRLECASVEAPQWKIPASKIIHPPVFDSVVYYFRGGQGKGLIL